MGRATLLLAVVVAVLALTAPVHPAVTYQYGFQLSNNNMLQCSGGAADVACSPPNCKCTSGTITGCPAHSPFLCAKAGNTAEQCVSNLADCPSDWVQSTQGWRRHRTNNKEYRYFDTQVKKHSDAHAECQAKGTDIDLADANADMLDYQKVLDVNDKLIHADGNPSTSAYKCGGFPFFCVCKPFYFRSSINKNPGFVRTNFLRCDDGRYTCQRAGDDIFQNGPCQSTPCQNGGTCTAAGYQFSCACPNGFFGQNCEKPCLASCPAGEQPTNQCSDQQACAPCPVNAFKEAVGLGSCQPCKSACAAGHFASTTCDQPGSALDVTCTPCSPNSFQDTAGLASTCQACTVQTCSAALVLVPCSATADSSCRACAAGEFRGADGTCQPCSTSCPVGHEQFSPCGGAQDLICLPCVAGTSFLDAGTGTCAACTSLCAAGEALFRACTPTQDLQCSQCAVSTFSPVASTLATCLACKTQCDAGAALGSECSATTDNVCTPCQAGSFSAQRDTATACTACTQCPTGQFARTACSLVSDTVCDPCPVGTYTDGPNNAAACSPCETACPRGSELSTCLPTAPAVCQPCAAGTFKFAADGSACSACRSCLPAQFESRACSAGADRQCTTCSTSCLPGLKPLTACNATSDLACADMDAPVITLIPTNVVIEAKPGPGYSLQDERAQTSVAQDTADGAVAVSLVVPSNTFPISTATPRFVLLTYTAIDAAGNRATAVRNVSVVDTTAPLLTLTGAATLVVLVNDAIADPGATASDFVDGDLTASIVVTGFPQSTAVAQRHTVTYTVTDSSRNSALVERLVIVENVPAPLVVIAGPPEPVVEAGSAFVEPNATTLNLPPMTVPAITVSGTVNPLVPGVYNLTYTDSAASPPATSVLTVTVRDTTPPVIVLLNGSRMVHEGGFPWREPGFTATDSISAVVASAGTPNVTAAAGSVEVVTYTASDASGNSATTERLVTIIDTLAPRVVLLGPARVDVPFNQDLAAFFNDPMANATDALDGSVAVVRSGNVDTGLLGNYTLSYTATDRAQNTASVTRLVVVVDVTPPVVDLQCPDRVEARPPSAPFESPFLCTALDDVDERAVDITITTGFNVSVLGDYMVSCRATDLSGNPSSKSCLTRVVDRTPPVITLLSAEEVVEAGSAWTDTHVVSVLDSFEGDVSGSLALEVERIESTLPTSIELAATCLDPKPVYPFESLYRPVTDAVVTLAFSGVSYRLFYTVTDTQGNLGKAERTVRIRDSTPPRLFRSGPSVVLLDFRQDTSLVYRDPGITASDLGIDLTSEICPTYTVVANPGDTNLSTSGEIDAELVKPSYPLGTAFEIRFQIVDFAGLPATDIRQVVVADISPPVLLLADPAPFHLPFGTRYIREAFVALDEHDGNVNSLVTIAGVSTLDTFATGQTSIRFQLTDSSGNRDTMNRIVVVDELEDPGPGFKLNVTLSLSADEFVQDERLILDQISTDLLQNDYVFAFGHRAVAPGARRRRHLSQQQAGQVVVTVAARDFADLEWVPRDVLRLGLVTTFNVPGLGVVTIITVEDFDAAQQQGSSSADVPAGAIAGALVGALVLLALVYVGYRYREAHRPKVETVAPERDGSSALYSNPLYGPNDSKNSLNPLFGADPNLNTTPDYAEPIQFVVPKESSTDDTGADSADSDYIGFSRESSTDTGGQQYALAQAGQGVRPVPAYALAKTEGPASAPVYVEPVASNPAYGREYVEPVASNPAYGSEYVEPVASNPAYGGATAPSYAEPVAQSPDYHYQEADSAAAGALYVEPVALNPEYGGSGEDTGGAGEYVEPSVLATVLEGEGEEEDEDEEEGTASFGFAAANAAAAAAPQYAVPTKGPGPAPEYAVPGVQQQQDGAAPGSAALYASTNDWEGGVMATFAREGDTTRRDTVTTRLALDANGADTHGEGALPATYATPNKLAKAGAGAGAGASDGYAAFSSKPVTTAGEGAAPDAYATPNKPKPGASDGYAAFSSKPATVPSGSPGDPAYAVPTTQAKAQYYASPGSQPQQGPGEVLYASTNEWEAGAEPMVLVSPRAALAGGQQAVEPWDHGLIDRETAEARLREGGMADGLFLVRESGGGRAHAVSYVVDGKVVHNKLSLDTDGLVCVNGKRNDTPLRSFGDLIRHFSYRFTTPCNRPGDAQLGGS